MMHKTAMLFSLALLGACADYRFTVNEQVVYSPTPLFSDYSVPDKALEECMTQHIRDRSATNVSQLEEINCSHAGVSSLEGIQTFTEIFRLKLSDNAIADLGPLASLTKLKELHLKGNPVRGLLPLRGLIRLDYLNLAENDELVCSELEYFKALPTLELVAPAHC